MNYCVLIELERRLECWQKIYSATQPPGTQLIVVVFSNYFAVTASHLSQPQEIACDVLSFSLCGTRPVERGAVWRRERTRFFASSFLFLSAIAIHTENPVRTFAARPRHKRSIFYTVIVLFYAVSLFLSHCASTAVSTSCALWGLGEMEIGSARPCAAMTPVALLFHFHIFNSGRSSTCLSCTYTYVSAPGYILSARPIRLGYTHMCKQFRFFSGVTRKRWRARSREKRECRSEFPSREAGNLFNCERQGNHSTARRCRIFKLRSPISPQAVLCFIFSAFAALVPHCYMHQIFPQWHAGAFFIPTYFFPLFEFRACSAAEWMACFSISPSEWRRQRVVMQPARQLSACRLPILDFGLTWDNSGIMLSSPLIILPAITSIGTLQGDEDSAYPNILVAFNLKSMSETVCIVHKLEPRTQNVLQAMSHNFCFISHRAVLLHTLCSYNLKP